VIGRHRSESGSTTTAHRPQVRVLLTMTTCSRYYAAIRRGTENPGVGGSIPSQPTILLTLARREPERRFLLRRLTEVGG
jgi:hypothetical protein